MESRHFSSLSRMVDHYNDLRSILRPVAPAALLSAKASGSSCYVAMVYESFADVSSFKPVFSIGIFLCKCLSFVLD